MSRIHIVRRHNGDVESARRAAEEAAGHMAEHYDIEYEWQGDHIHFSRPGVDGVMKIGSDQIEIEAHLSFFLALMKPTIEDEIEKELDQHFGGPKC